MLRIFPSEFKGVDPSWFGQVSVREVRLVLCSTIVFTIGNINSFDYQNILANNFVPLRDGVIRLWQYTLDEQDFDN